jgi:glycosyltransferase involved in cell wall biosynthesis
MRLLYVVQRYGEQIAGGAEQHAREFAERLVERDHRVTVLTTCAKSYVDWANEYPRGWSHSNGVAVYRVPVEQRRNPHLFSRFNTRMNTAAGVRPLAVQREWMQMQGPYAPTLVPWIRHHARSYDAVVFITYLYWTTWAGLRECAGAVPTLLHPTAHDEPPMRLSIFQEVMRAPDAFAFLTPEEGDLVRGRFPGAPPGDVVGIGVEMDRDGDAAKFRRRFGLGTAPYLLYVGRVDPAKGAAELIDYFIACKARTPSDLKLVLLGELLVDDPKRPDVIVTGFVDEATRNGALAGSLGLVHPSYFESFAMVLTESFAQRRPALVQRRAAVLAGHAERSSGAIPYTGFAEFEAAVERLRTDSALADRLGAAGRRYVEQEYGWDVVLDRYEHTLDRVAHRAFVRDAVVNAG